MKYTERGLITQPEIITGDAESIIPANHLGDLLKVLSLDALLLELENPGDIVIHIDGQDLRAKIDS